MSGSILVVRALPETAAATLYRGGGVRGLHFLRDTSETFRALSGIGAGRKSGFSTVSSSPGGGMLPRHRALVELLQLAREVIADGRVSEREAALFRRWVQAHPGMLGVKAVDDLARALRRIFVDGKVEPEERQELLKMLRRVAGEEGNASDHTFGEPWDDEISNSDRRG